MEKQVNKLLWSKIKKDLNGNKTIETADLSIESIGGYGYVREIIVIKDDEEFEIDPEYINKKIENEVRN